ncbi:3-oxoacyl-ACP synthase (plasmid) [Halobaculum sp. CBA1158]|uniref:3-oxoacyl-ACP synthase n=1 Tax=Halobaculum sp. CBA1158 TaxID=2904243 RepID=UPI001F4567F8|nr:3-oxoacyl-ACP synthase [Halobaculum sp. CBA1158]UIP01338.1 3-oxoacyl-ACP synthase [Halobaculum sp. CBA1158]
MSEGDAVAGDKATGAGDAPQLSDARGSPGRTVALTGLATYVPSEVLTGEAIAAESGIPEDVIVEKMGLREKRVCPPDDDHVSDMCVAAGREALADAGVDAADLDLVLYHGSEYKDHVVWSAAADVCERLGASDAYAHESYTLCAGAPVAIRHTAAQLRVGDIDTALLVTASREEDLVDYGDEDASFMFNFGSGAAATVLEAEPAADRTRALVRESAATTDGSFSRDVVMPAGGSARPPSRETVDAGEHTLTVPDPDDMKERLADVSAPAFLSVADDALAASGYDRDAVDFLALTHMKRSFHEYLRGELGVDEDESYYLDDYGHVQSADQALALRAGLDRDRVGDGDVVLLLAAGTGYTWAATVLEWTDD